MLVSFSHIDFYLVIGILEIYRMSNLADRSPLVLWFLKNLFMCINQKLGIFLENKKSMDLLINEIAFCQDLLMSLFLKKEENFDDVIIAKNRLTLLKDMFFTLAFQKKQKNNIDVVKKINFIINILSINNNEKNIYFSCILLLDQLQKTLINRGFYEK